MLSIKAVVTVQRISRGFIARNRVKGRRRALAILQSACLGVAIDVIDAHIREVSAPNKLRQTFRAAAAIPADACDDPDYGRE